MKKAEFTPLRCPSSPLKSEVHDLRVVVSGALGMTIETCIHCGVLAVRKAAAGPGNSESVSFYQAVAQQLVSWEVP